MYERRIESNRALCQADSELKETFSPLLLKFYKLFESVHLYVRDVIAFLEDLENVRIFL